MTFDPHPIRALNHPQRAPASDHPLYEQKEELIAESRHRRADLHPLHHGFCRLVRTDLRCEDILVKRIGMKAIVVGQRLYLRATSVKAMWNC
jgi:hypothetical protein